MARKKARPAKKSSPKKSTPKKSARKSPAAKGRKSKGFGETKAGLDNAWKKSRESVPDAGGFGPNENVPDGRYVARVVGFVTKKARSGNRYIRMTFSLLGDLDGERVQSFDELSTTEAYGGKSRMDVASERLQMCGVDTRQIDSLEELPEVGKQLVADKQAVRVSVRNRHVPADESNDGEDHDYQDVFCNGAVAESDIDDLIAEFAAEG